MESRGLNKPTPRFYSYAKLQLWHLSALNKDSDNLGITQDFLDLTHRQTFANTILKRRLCKGGFGNSMESLQEGFRSVSANIYHDLGITSKEGKAKRDVM